MSCHLTPYHITSRLTTVCAAYRSLRSLAQESDELADLVTSKLYEPFLRWVRAIQYSYAMFCSANCCMRVLWLASWTNAFPHSTSSLATPPISVQIPRCLSRHAKFSPLYPLPLSSFFSSPFCSNLLVFFSSPLSSLIFSSPFSCHICSSPFLSHLLSFFHLSFFLFSSISFSPFIFSSFFYSCLFPPPIFSFLFSYFLTSSPLFSHLLSSLPYSTLLLSSSFLSTLLYSTPLIFFLLFSSIVFSFLLSLSLSLIFFLLFSSLLFSSIVFLSLFSSLLSSPLLLPSLFLIFPTPFFSFLLISSIRSVERHPCGLCVDISPYFFQPLCFWRAMWVAENRIW